MIDEIIISSLKLIAALKGRLPRKFHIEPSCDSFQETEERDVLYDKNGQIVTYGDGQIKKIVIHTLSPGNYGSYVFVPEEYTLKSFGPLAFGWEIYGPTEVTYCWNHCPGLQHFAGEFVKPLAGSKLMKRVSLFTENFKSRIYWRDYMRQHGILDLV